MYIHKGGTVNKGCRFLGVTCIGFFVHKVAGGLNEGRSAQLLAFPPLSFHCCHDNPCRGSNAIVGMRLYGQLRPAFCSLCWAPLQAGYIMIGFAFVLCQTSSPACLCWCTVLAHLLDALAGDYLSKKEGGSL